MVKLQKDRKKERFGGKMFKEKLENKRTNPK
jgi:hypothetical protein